MALLASWSQRSFSGWPLWPFTHIQVMVWRWPNLWSSCQSSWFFTGWRDAVFHPLQIQPFIHSVIPFTTYWESVVNLILQGSWSCLRATMAAVISIMLLVVCGWPPLISRMSPFCLMMHPYPPGPGLPLHPPSVNISTVFMVWILDKSWNFGSGF